MKEVCDCDSITSPARPVKYRLDEKFGSYRRKAKIAEYTKRGLL